MFFSDIGSFLGELVSDWFDWTGAINVILRFLQTVFGLNLFG